MLPTCPPKTIEPNRVDDCDCSHFLIKTDNSPIVERITHRDHTSLIHETEERINTVALQLMLIARAIAS